jgi:hypothetical protein
MRRRFFGALLTAVLLAGPFVAHAVAAAANPFSIMFACGKCWYIECWLVCFAQIVAP